MKLPLYGSLGNSMGFSKMSSFNIRYAFIVVLLRKYAMQLIYSGGICQDGL